MLTEWIKFFQELFDRAVDWRIFRVQVQVITFVGIVVRTLNIGVCFGEVTVDKLNMVSASSTVVANTIRETWVSDSPWSVLVKSSS